MANDWTFLSVLVGKRERCDDDDDNDVGSNGMKDRRGFGAGLESVMK